MVDEPGKTGYNISTYSDVRQIYAPVMELVDMRDLGRVTLVKVFWYGFLDDCKTGSEKRSAGDILCTW